MSIDLCCCSCAGGTVHLFEEFTKHLDHEIYYRLHEYPGRGGRFCEPMLEDIQLLAQDAIENSMQEVINNRSEYVLLGYSMGALVVLEMSTILTKLHGLKPKHIFIMAHGAPPLVDDEWKNISGMELLHKTNEMGGMDAELENNSDFVYLFLERMEADIKAVNTYREKEFYEVSCPMSIIYSDYDNKKNTIHNWSSITNNPCIYYPVPGNHFFINDMPEHLAGIVNNTLMH